MLTTRHSRASAIIAVEVPEVVHRADPCPNPWQATTKLRHSAMVGGIRVCKKVEHDRVEGSKASLKFPGSNSKP
jgi:hypothetical protein